MTATVSDYVSLITSEHRDKPKYVAVIETITSFAVDERNLVDKLPVDFDVNEAVGVQLDACAAWAGVSRTITIQPSDAFPLPAAPYQVELDDDTLRRLILARVLANRWDGTPEQTVVILAAFYSPVGSAAAIVDNQDMSIDLILAGTFPSAAEAAVLSQFILPVRPAGVFVKNTHISPVGGPLFGLDIDNEFIGGPDHGSFGVPFI